MPDGAPGGPPPPPPPPPPWSAPWPTDPREARGEGALGWPPPPTPRHGKLTWLWVLLGVVLALGLAGVVTVIVLVRAVDAPVTTMNRYLGAVQRGDFDSAYDMLCRDERDDTARESFPATIEPFARDLNDYLAFSFDPFGNERTVYYTVAGTGDDDPYSAKVVREDGAWRVCDFFE